ncbi:hypothetical protein C8R45DRAFT_1006325 [Mycena sanguinolenta]|nr:hypothetical protein C8R45DRAFT_1045200 [Mycena sanguinolenta]KAJ6478950.1 hypothetical protein C8R45DRAFT_1006325 [Mycena sanguinolenta]
MSSQDAELFALRDVYLNITLLQAFGNGVYFVVFSLAFYAMIFRRKTHPLLFFVVVAQFIFASIETGVHWSNIRTAFVIHGTSVDDTVEALTDPTFTQVVLPATLLVVNTFLADCVLIFRLYAVWNHDWRVIVLPVMSTIGGTVLGILTVVESGNFIKDGGDSNAFVDFALPYFSMCLVTTLLATILIVSRIIWVTRAQTGSAFSGYRSVIEMIVESALLYSVTLIVYIALLFGPDTDNNDGYAQAILIHMTGIAPTLIVARVSFGLARPSSSWQRTARTTFGMSNTSFARQVEFVAKGDPESSSVERKGQQSNSPKY